MLLSVVLCFLLLFLPTPARVTAQAATTSKKDIQAKIDALDKEIKAKEQKIQENNREKAKAQKSANELQGQVDDLQSQITAYNSKIDTLNGKIATLNNDINATEQQIAQTEAEMSVIKQKIADTQAALAGRMKAMYMTGNVSNLELLLDSDSFPEFLTRLEMLDRITKHDNKIIKGLKKEIAKSEEQQRTLKRAETSLQADKQEVQASKTELQTSKSEVAVKKSELDQEVSKLDRYMNGLDANSKELQASIRAAQQQQAAWMAALNSSLSGRTSTGTGTVDITLNPGGMIWPVASGSSYISSGYGSRSVKGSSFHYGIDITDPNGGSGTVPIVAAATGRVTIASNACPHNYRKNYNCGCNGGYGNYVVIDHGNGLVSYYGHMTRAVVGAGQHVSQGQVIGYMGSTGFSTGPHLHFEIRVNNGQSRSLAARNPLNYVHR